METYLLAFQFSFCYIICCVGMLFAVHKAHREELECVLQILEKVLVYLPELLSKRWQCHSLTRIMTKLLHPGNSWKLRREAIRYVSKIFTASHEYSYSCAGHLSQHLKLFDCIDYSFCISALYLNTWMLVLFLDSVSCSWWRLEARSILICSFKNVQRVVKIIPPPPPMETQNLHKFK